MKATLHLIGLLTLAAIPTTHADESAPQAQAASTAKETITKAKAAMTKARASAEELSVLQRRESDGVRPLKKSENKQLAKLLADRYAATELNRQIAGMLKVGDSVFTCPGLLSLSEVSFDEATNRYSLQLVVAYDSYEGGPPRFPRNRIIEFDDHGRITALSEFATVKMVTE